MTLVGIDRTLIALALLGAGCGAITSAPSDAGHDGPQSMLDACPPTPVMGPTLLPCEPGLVCEYNVSTQPLCGGTQSCLADGGWRDTRSLISCPTQATCPTSPPAGACNSQAWPEVCEYPDAGVDCVCAPCKVGKLASTLAWYCFAPDPACATRPRLGTACSDPTARCEYPPGCCGAFVQKCARGVWMQEEQPGCPP